MAGDDFGDFGEGSEVDGSEVGADGVDDYGEESGIEGEEGDGEEEEQGDED